MLIQKLPDYNGGFITKSIEGARVITRDAEENIIHDVPINLIKKGVKTNFGKVIECGEDYVIIKDGLKTLRAGKHLLNASLHKSKELVAPRITNTESGGTFETPIGSVVANQITDDIREVLTNPDHIKHHASYSVFFKALGTKVIKATIAEPLFKAAFLKSIDTETKGKKITLFKSTAKIFDISTSSGSMAWNAKGGMKPDHKYIERKPNPSGEGYIYLYELPNGGKEWRDKSGEAIQEQAASKEYKIDYKPGEAIRISGKVGLIKEVSDNFLAVNVEGKMITINKTEHVQKLDQQKGFYEGAQIVHEGSKAKILKLTGALALVQDLKSNRMKVIEVEQPISKADDVNPKEHRQTMKDKYSHVYQGYDAEDYAYNLDYEKQPAYNQFWESAKQAGFGRIDELTARKFVKINENETSNITWTYNPETGETDFLINGSHDYPLYYEGKKYFVRDITELGYSLEDSETKETGLFLGHADYKNYKLQEYQKEKKNEVVNKNADPYGGITFSEKSEKINIKPEYTEEQLARFNRKQFGGRWGRAQQAKQTAEKIRLENEVNQKALKEKLNSKEYKNFSSELEGRGYKITENAFRAKKEVEVEGNKFKLVKTFDGETQIDGPTTELKLGNDSYAITDITKDKIFYDNDGREESKTVEELKTINGKNIFEPTKVSKGIISNLPAAKIYFGTEDKDTTSGYYEIVEAGELVPSNMAGGEANPFYKIGNAQNRDRSKQQSLAQIDKIANNPNFDFVSDDKTAQNGAPIVNQDYNVIAGNGRAIGLIKHYELGKEKYKNDLVKNAKRLGFDTDEVSKMNNPILIRRTNVADEEAQRLGAISNQDQKLALEESETAKGMATRINDKTFNKIADMFSNAKGEFTSISDYLEDVGPELVKELVKRNIIPENEQHLFYNLESGRLNASNKEKVKELLTQSILGEASAHFEKISNAAREGITKGLGDVFALKGKEGDLVPHITEAVKMLSKYESMKENFKSTDDFITQAANDAFEPLSADKKTLALFDLFAGTKPNEMKDKLREYRMSMEPDMFSEGLSPDVAFDQTFKPKYEEGVNQSDKANPRSSQRGAARKSTKPQGKEITIDEKQISKMFNEGKTINEITKELGLPRQKVFDTIYRPTHSKEVNKSIIGRIKLFSKKFLKAVDTTKNVLLPSKKNPNVMRWQSIEEANKWIEDKSKEYGNKNKFLASDEYRNAYNEINDLHKQSANKFTDVAAEAMREASAKFGDRVEYSMASPFGEVFEYEGTIINRGGIPYVKLDRKTRDGKNFVKWHKGFKESGVKKQAQTETDTFKKWFGNSKVVDENGKPLVVYHGTRNNFDKFSDEHGAMYFADKPEYASNYAMGYKNERLGGNIIPVYLQIKNPKIIDYNGEPDTNLAVFDMPEAFQEGYDGIIAKNVDDGYGVYTQFITFLPSQIKSAIGNNGSFDPENPNITKSVGAKKLNEGIKIEGEHEDLYNELRDRLEKENVKMPMSKGKFFKWIAKQHLSENDNYYELLKKYVE
jgi:hypothetical protein